MKIIFKIAMALAIAALVVAVLYKLGIIEVDANEAEGDLLEEEVDAA